MEDTFRTTIVWILIIFCTTGCKIEAENPFTKYGYYHYTRYNCLDDNYIELHVNALIDSIVFEYHEFRFDRISPLWVPREKINDPNGFSGDTIKVESLATDRILLKVNQDSYFLKSIKFTPFNGLDFYSYDENDYEGYNARKHSRSN